MSWSKRINSLKYVIGTLLNFGFAIYAGLPNYEKVWWLCFVVISAVLNHFFMVLSLNKLAESRIAKINAKGNFQLFIYLICKTMFLGAGFICLMVYSPDKVPQGLIIYIFQLIIFGLSIKNIGKFFKKGP
jgi:hypothetical protein